jgi:hypothetical protein
MTDAPAPPPDQTCREPGPGSGGDRLRTAIAAIESAIGCVDYHTLGWQPAEKDAWDRASQYLWEARNALELAETLWESPPEKRPPEKRG